jgi:hypothetical protein
MLSDFRSIVLLAICASLEACAGTPPTPTPSVGTAAPAQPASMSVSAPSNTPAAAPATAASASDVDANLVKSGYSVMRRHSQIYYCRNEIITGQRIGTRVCLTVEQIQNEKQNVTKAQDVLSHPGDRCTKPMCVN